MILAELQARVANARRVCKVHGIAQADIAAHLGASQPQVSRILKGKGVRFSRLFEEVCLFVERFEGGVTLEAVRSNPDLTAALQATWDGSASHAKALSAVIRSLAVLGTSQPSTFVSGDLP